MPEALFALDILVLTLPPALSGLAERGTRKLRMSGVRRPTAPAAAQGEQWRALLSPVDGAGLQLIWFILYLWGRTQEHCSPWLRVMPMAS